MFDNFLELLGLDDIFADDDDVAEENLNLQSEETENTADPSLYPQGTPHELDSLPVGDEDGVLYDLDNNGIFDAVVTQQEFDTNNDGVSDTFVTEYGFDTNGDNFIDVVQTDTTIHLDDDGVAEYFHSELELDVDNDGIADFFISADDYTGDGIFENVEILEAITQTPYNTDEQDNISFDGNVIGDPESAMDDWHWQETGSSCAVASQEFVLEELTGLEFEEADLRDLAEANGWYDPDGGTPQDDVGNILEYMGLTVNKSTGGTIEDIANCLANDGEVIVSIDSGELWYGENDDFWGPGMQADHAIQVIGIDYSDPNQTMVIINDPGSPNGAGMTITLELFEEIWEDGDNFMVEAYA